MANIDRAFRVDAVSLGDSIGIFFGDIDPSSIGYEAPVGSLFLSTAGFIYQKTNTQDTDWAELKQAVGHTHQAITTSYSASDKTVILVDSTATPVTVTLPTAASYTGSFFHVKWHDGVSNNKVTVTTQDAATIDGNTSIILGEIEDNLKFFSDGTNWWIL